MLGNGLTSEKLRRLAAAHERAGWLMRRMAVASDTRDVPTIRACLQELAGLEPELRR